MYLFANRKISIPWLITGLFFLSVAVAVYREEFYWLILPLAALVFYSGWQQPRLVFFLLLLALPFSFEYNFSPSLGTDIPDEGLMLLVSFLFFAYWLYKPVIIPLTCWKHPLIFLLFIHLSWILVSVLFSTHPLLSVKFLLAKTWYMGSFVLAALVVFQSRENIKMAGVSLTIAVLTMAVVALIRHAQHGFSFAMINESVSPFFRNHVNYSSMLVCLVPVLFAFQRGAKQKQVRLWLGIGLATLLVAIFFSYARGAWLALGTGILAVWLMKKRLLLVAYIAAIILTLSTVFWLQSNDRYLRYAHDFNTTIFHENFGQHLVATYKLKDVSTAERFYRWVAAIRMVKDSWLHGFGPGSFYEQYKSYTIPAYKTWVSDNKEHSTVHNYFLLLMIEQGVPGLLFFLVLLGAMLYYAQKLVHRMADPFYKTLALTIGSVIVMIATVNFLSDLIETDKIGSLFFLSFSLLIICDIHSRKMKPGKQEV